MGKLKQAKTIHAFIYIQRASITHKLTRFCGLETKAD